MSRQDTIGPHKTNHCTTNGVLRVVYHSTEVVRVDAKRIFLDTGGFYTATTKTRMNQASAQYDLGYHVQQKNGSWFCTYKGKTMPFESNELNFAR